MQTKRKKIDRLSRRAFCAGAAAVCGGAVISPAARSAAAQPADDVPPEDYPVVHRRIQGLRTPDRVDLLGLIEELWIEEP